MGENWIKVAIYQKVTSEVYISLFQLALSTHLRVRSVNFPPGSPGTLLISLAICFIITEHFPVEWGNWISYGRKKWGGFKPLQLIVCGSGYWGHGPEITESCTQPTRLQVNLINGQAQSARLSSIYTLSDIRDSNTKVVERRLNVQRI